MVIDTSALIAIIFDEAEAEDFERRIASDGVRLMSASTLLEATMVMEARLGEKGEEVLDFWLLKAGVEIVAFDAEQADLARRAWRRYGKGRHPAGLNFGDCFSYALAALRGEPLLFKGRDFAQTDIVAA
jgi:ribonuclease VapC